MSGNARLWLALVVFVLIVSCDPTSLVAWGFAAGFALAVLVAGQPAARRRRR